MPRETSEDWQENVDILAQVCTVPAALIMRLRDPEIEVFVSSDSPGNPYTPGDAEHVWDSGLYCETVIRTQNVLHVPDALADDDWKDNPDVKLNMVSYLGLPISLPGGRPFGTICILDDRRNDFNDTVRRLMRRFQAVVESQLETLYANQLLGDENKRLTDYLMELQALRGIVPICSSCKSIRDDSGGWHPIEEYLITHPKADFSHGLCPSCSRVFAEE